MMLIWVQPIQWAYSAETITILVVEFAVAIEAFKPIQTQADAYFVFALYPLSLVLVTVRLGRAGTTPLSSSSSLGGGVQSASSAASTTSSSASSDSLSEDGGGALLQCATKIREEQMNDRDDEVMEGKGPTRRRIATHNWHAVRPVIQQTLSTPDQPQLTIPASRENQPRPANSTTHALPGSEDSCRLERPWLCQWQETP